jgi:hypothetical protein
MEVAGGVLVWRRIAAAYVPADHAHPQVNPATAVLEAFLTALRFWGYLLDLIAVGTVSHAVS